MDLVLLRTTIVVVDGDAVTLDVEPAISLIERLYATEVQDAVQHTQVVALQNLLETYLLRMQVTDKDVAIAGIAVVLVLDTRQGQRTGDHV